MAMINQKAREIAKDILARLNLNPNAEIKAATRGYNVKRLKAKSLGYLSDETGVKKLQEDINTLGYTNVKVKLLKDASRGVVTPLLAFFVLYES